MAIHITCHRALAAASKMTMRPSREQQLKIFFESKPRIILGTESASRKGGLAAICWCPARLCEFPRLPSLQDMLKLMEKEMNTTDWAVSLVDFHETCGNKYLYFYEGSA